jgi:hypothetical protein
VAHPFKRMGLLMQNAVKFLPGSQDRILVRAIPFGGLLRGRDTDGEFFSKRTDLCLDWFPTERPLLYDHGLDLKTGVAVVGRVDSATLKQDDDGWWVQAQIDRAGEYYRVIRALIEQDVLYGSSGAMSHLTQKAANGEILRWPWVELSLTPTPANLLATVEMSAAKSHYKAAQIELPSNWNPGATAAKAGRVLSAANETALRQAMSALQAVLDKLSKEVASDGGKA